MEPLNSNAGERDLPSARALEYNDEIINGQLAPPKGLVQKSLFSQQISNDDERFERLESAVQSLHDTLQSHLPAIEKLTAIEGDIQELVGQLQTLVSGGPATAAAPPLDVQQENLADAQPQSMEPIYETGSSPAPSAAAAAPSAPETGSETGSEPGQSTAQPSYTAPDPAPVTAVAAVNPESASPAARTVNDVRVSQSPDKTRVVLDSVQKIDYTLDYDDQEGLILVTAKNADVAASLAAAAGKSTKIASISSARDGAHTNLIFVLKGSATVSSGVALSPNSDNSQYRYYFDIF